MRPREVVVHVRKVRRVRPEQFVELAVPVVVLYRRRLPVLARGCLTRQRGVRGIPRGEQAVERLKVIGVVSDTRVVRVPRLVEVRGAQALEVPQPGCTVRGATKRWPSRDTTRAFAFTNLVRSIQQHPCVTPARSSQRPTTILTPENTV